MTPRRWSLAAPLLTALLLTGCPDPSPDLPPTVPPPEVPPTAPPTPELPPAPPPRHVDDGETEAGAVGLLGQAHDPVCGLAVDLTGPAQTATHAGIAYRFCGDACRETFLKEPARYAHPGRE